MHILDFPPSERPGQPDKPAPRPSFRTGHGPANAAEEFHALMQALLSGAWAAGGAVPPADLSGGPDGETGGAGGREPAAATGPAADTLPGRPGSGPAVGGARWTPRPILPGRWPVMGNALGLPGGMGAFAAALDGQGLAAEGQEGLDADMPGGGALKQAAGTAGTAGGDGLDGVPEGPWASADGSQAGGTVTSVPGTAPPDADRPEAVAPLRRSGRVYAGTRAARRRMARLAAARAARLQDGSTGAERIRHGGVGAGQVREGEARDAQGAEHRAGNGQSTDAQAGTLHAPQSPSGGVPSGEVPDQLPTFPGILGQAHGPPPSASQPGEDGVEALGHAGGDGEGAATAALRLTGEPHGRTDAAAGRPAGALSQPIAAHHPTLQGAGGRQVDGPWAGTGAAVTGPAFRPGSPAAGLPNQGWTSWPPSAAPAGAGGPWAEASSTAAHAGNGSVPSTGGLPVNAGSGAREHPVLGLQGAPGGGGPGLPGSIVEAVGPFRTTPGTGVAAVRGQTGLGDVAAGEADAAYGHGVAGDGGAGRGRGMGAGQGSGSTLGAAGPGNAPGGPVASGEAPEDPGAGGARQVPGLGARPWLSGAGGTGFGRSDGGSFGGLEARDSAASSPSGHGEEAGVKFALFLQSQPLAVLREAPGAPASARAAVLQQLATHLQDMVASFRQETAPGGVEQVSIRLHPEYLGEVVLRISVDPGGSVVAHFSVDNPQVRSWIEQDLPQLRIALAEHGLQLTDAGVDSGPGSDGGSWLHAGGSPGTDWHGGSGFGQSSSQPGEALAWGSGSGPPGSPEEAEPETGEPAGMLDRYRTALIDVLA